MNNITNGNWTNQIQLLEFLVILSFLREFECHTSIIEYTIEW